MTASTNPRVPPSEKLGQEASAVFEGLARDEHPLDALVNLGARLILQTYVEWEATKFLGRPRYDRSAGERAGLRNGYRDKSVYTGEGVLKVQIPELRGTNKHERFRSTLGQEGKVRTETLERLALLSYVKGLVHA